jgi:predicted nucleic acid-binding protein
LAKAIVLDTSIIINFFDGIEGIPKLHSLVKEQDCFVIVVTRMELLKYPEITAEEEIRIRSFLSNIVVIPIDDSIEQETIRISRSTKLKLPDAIIAATAITIDAELSATDPHFVECKYPALRVMPL